MDLRQISKSISSRWTPFSFFFFSIILTSSLFMTASSQKQPDVTFVVREEQEKGTYVGNVARNSKIYQQFNQSDLANLQYSIPPKNAKMFTIDPKTSNIRTARKLDREQECEGLFPTESCILTIAVSIIRVSGETFRLLKVINVGVIITDVNDNAPEFPSNKTILDVPESRAVGETLRTSGAIDRDSGTNNTVQGYSLQGGGGVFQLEVLSNPNAPSADLGIVLKSKLDREKKDSYALKIIAEDGGYPKLTGTVDIVINVVDVNDNTPTFSQDRFEKTVPENAKVASTVLTLLASDSDEQENGELSFAFSSLTSGKVREHFSINKTSGAIVIRKALDYEKDQRYRFTALVSDNGSPPRSSMTSVIISVKDVNDNAPQLDITIPSSKIKESTEVGNYIAHISLSDLDSNSGISCNIANPHFVLQKFPDSESIFTVLLHKRLDYEKAHTEIVNVSCSDGGNPPRTNSSSFVINVVDVNDNSPIFTRNSYKFKINENNYVGQFVAQIQAVDPDEGENGNVTYSLIKNPESKFQINGVSGVIKALAELDRESEPSYELVVRARDGGVPAIESSATVTVVVNDINDNPPHFSRPHFDFRVPENQQIHTIVDRVIADDVDTHSDNHLRYEFTENFPYANVFDMDRRSGSISTLKKLDREKNDSFSFNVRVYDETNPQFTDTTRVTVLVQDENDVPPRITYPDEFNNTFHILYSKTVGLVVIKVKAEDSDAGENGTISYSIANGNEKGLFFINSLTGDLLIAKRMNIYDSGAYKLEVRARDGGSSFLESTRDINLIVTVANGTIGAFSDDDDSTNIAIVIALVCVTTVLAIAVLITICIIRRIDRERKHHHHAKVEEENIYKQRAVVVPGTPQRGDTMGNYDNEIDKLKRKIKHDMSFVIEDDSNPMDGTDNSTKSSTFSTFKNTSTSQLDQKHLSSPHAHSSVLQNTLSPSDSNPKRVHYMDKGLDIDRLTNNTPPPRSHPTANLAPSLSSSQSSMRGGKQPSSTSGWPSARSKSSRGSLVKVPLEDAASHSSGGSTSDSGRGCSSEEGEGHSQGQAQAQQSQGQMGVNLGDSERPTLHAYPTSAPLMTFGSPRSTAGSSSSGTSHLPRSLSSSWNPSETGTKKFLNDVTPGSSLSSPNSSQTSSILSSSLASSFVNQNPNPTHQHQRQRGRRDNNIASSSPSVLKPNISLSDDSVTANSFIRPSGKRSPKSKKHHQQQHNTNTQPLRPIKNINKNSNNNDNNNNHSNNLSRFGLARSTDALELQLPLSSSSSAPPPPAPPPSTTSSSLSSDPSSSKPSQNSNANTFTSTTRPRGVTPYDKSSDSPFRLLEPNLSRIASADSSVRHGMYVDATGTSMIIDPPSVSNNSRSRSYAAVNGCGIGGSGLSGSGNGLSGNGFNGVDGSGRRINSRLPGHNGTDRGGSHRNSYHGGDESGVVGNGSMMGSAGNRNNGEHNNAHASGWRPANLNRFSSCENNALQQSGNNSTSLGDPYSLADMDDILRGSGNSSVSNLSASNAGSRGGGMDDDATTTTSGSYTINADDLCQEIDHLFFNDVVV